VYEKKLRRSFYERGDKRGKKAFKKNEVPVALLW
jgi:hypothetical protein